jgi:hypothetical protein
LLACGRWFSLGTPPSSTTKTGCHDIAEILLKVALNTKIQFYIGSYMDVAVMVLKGMKFHQRCGSYYVVVIYVMLYH